MIKVIQDWFKRYFSDPEAVLLLAVLACGFGTVLIMGDILAPVISSMIIAYFLQWWVELLLRYNISHRVAYNAVFIGFLSVFFISLLFILPPVWRQLSTLFNELPWMIQKGKNLVLDFSQHHNYFSEQQINTITATLMQDIQGWGKRALSVSLSSIPGVMAWFVYLFLVPMLVYFFLKDHGKIIKWFKNYLPKKHGLLTTIWLEVDRQIGNYIRGKIYEITVVGFATYLVFYFFDLHYQVLLSVLVGLSVVIPYVGAVVVTIPVILVGYFQWGLTMDFASMLAAYLVVQGLDANILVPLLFSEAVNLHPVAIIVAILFFGGMWGFWGVFFAIPLATLIKSTLNAWPRGSKR